MDELIAKLPAIVLAGYILVNKYAPDLFKTSKQDGVKCVTPEEFKELKNKVEQHGDDISFMKGKLSK